VLACLGFARRHLRGRDGPARRWLTLAVFPCYILHQTLIVVMAHHLVRLGLPQGLEATLLIALTFTLCLGAVWLLRQLPGLAWLRTCLGLPPGNPVS
jgi:glucan biosynthesis protein C